MARVVDMRWDFSLGNTPKPSTSHPGIALVMTYIASLAAMVRVTPRYPSLQQALGIVGHAGIRRPGDGTGCKCFASRECCAVAIGLIEVTHATQSAQARVNL